MSYFFVLLHFLGKGIVSVAKRKFYLYIYLLKYHFTWKSSSNVQPQVAVELKEWSYIYKIQQS